LYIKFKKDKRISLNPNSQKIPVNNPNSMQPNTSPSLKSTSNSQTNKYSFTYHIVNNPPAIKTHVHRKILLKLHIEQRTNSNHGLLLRYFLLNSRKGSRVSNILNESKTSVLPLKPSLHLDFPTRSRHRVYP
jgi:hypothetical protein